MTNAFDDFISRHALSTNYLNLADKFFVPVAEQLLTKQIANQKPLIVGLNGCQGSGKTTLADFLTTYFSQVDINAISVSIDDFYYPKPLRLELSKKTHPLLITRGVPGTHDVALLQNLLNAVTAKEKNIVIPRFDKATDDRCPSSKWQKVDNVIDILIIEGWCWGVTHSEASALEAPINALESQEDANGHWRRYVNDALAKDYEPLYKYVDSWLMLKAPDFDCVYQWRLEQEQKLILRCNTELKTQKHLSGLMTPEQVKRFIQHYQRITEHLLDSLPNSADVVWHLNQDRSIQHTTTRNIFSGLSLSWNQEN